MTYSKHKIFFIGLMVVICACMLWTMRPVKIIRAGIRFEYDSQFKQGLLIGSLRGLRIMKVTMSLLIICR